ncbi:ribonuclease P protein component [Fontimonas sp. SYSU GA230001]|uniref:ribonuclease P protein component n=1 Tax=Fontimonas sp. SYSU GA230001 TaxID=3142450 RepID=UPI0032B3A23F
MARFPRRARLLTAPEFDATFRLGSRHSERWLTAISARNDRTHARLGLAIARKSVPLAVHRNRIKRRIRESFRLHQHRLPAVDIVLLARPGCEQASAAELDRSLERLWNRIAASSLKSSAR